MAIELYKIFLNKIDEPTIYDSLMTIQVTHLKHKQIITQRIRQLGGKPIGDQSSLVAKLTELMSKVKTVIYPDYGDIIKDLYNGELMGIDQTQQLIYNNLPVLDREIIQSILADQVDILHALKKLLKNLAKEKVH